MPAAASSAATAAAAETATAAAAAAAAQVVTAEEICSQILFYVPITREILRPAVHSDLWYEPAADVRSITMFEKHALPALRATTRFAWRHIFSFVPK